MSFEELLKAAHLTKRELARRLGINENTPSNWQKSPPSYAVAYLKLMLEKNA